MVTTMLAPCSWVATMRPDLHAAEAADQYVTHGHDKVPPHVIREALVYLEFAAAAYYIQVMASLVCQLACDILHVATKPQILVTRPGLPLFT